MHDCKEFLGFFVYTGFPGEKRGKLYTMIGLEIIAAGLLHYAQYSTGQNTAQNSARTSGSGTSQKTAEKIVCEAPSKPTVKVVPSKSTISYDFSVPQSGLNNKQIDTESPYGAGHETEVGGLMSGEISIESRMSFIQSQYTHVNKVCLHYDQIEVTLHIDPTIYIASEYTQGSCKHNAIMEHEKKHVKVDRIVVNRYANRIAKAITHALNKYGSSYGPYDMANMEKAQESLQKYITGIVDKESANLSSERRRLQQSVDTKKEYERVRLQCEGK